MLSQSSNVGGPAAAKSANKVRHRLPVEGGFCMTTRTYSRLVAAAAAAVLLALPQIATAQAGIGAWDFEHPVPGPGGGGIALNRVLGGNAAGDGVAKPLGFKESTPKVTATPEPAVDPKIEYAKGFTDLGYGDYQRAEIDFDHVLKVEPKNFKAMFMLGVAFNSAGDTRKAAGVWGDAVQVEPEQIDARREYAVALARLGETDQAQAQYSVLKHRADACGGKCADAVVLSSSLARIQSALSVFVKS
jgi:tetratricopeptide (TPR) repeat protein